MADVCEPGKKNGEIPKIFIFSGNKSPGKYTCFTVFKIMIFMVFFCVFQITPHAIRVLEKEKNSLEGQLRDLEWRLDQESKV